MPALATRGNRGPITHDHFRGDFDRRFRRLLAGAAVVEAGAATIENFGRLPTALLATAVGELLLRLLLGGPVVTDTGAAVIEDCEVPYKFSSATVAETCFDQITTVHCHCPGKATSPGCAPKTASEQVGSQAGVLGAAYGGSR